MTKQTNCFHSSYKFLNIKREKCTITIPLTQTATDVSNSPSKNLQDKRKQVAERYDDNTLNAPIHDSFLSSRQAKSTLMRTLTQPDTGTANTSPAHIYVIHSDRQTDEAT